MADEDDEETPEMATKEPQLPEEKTETLIVEKLPSPPTLSEENLGTDGLSSNPVESRENLVHTAVSFLQNPKVRDGPVTQKKAFLRKKGLTEDEISDAFLKSGTVEHLPQPMVPYPLSPPPMLQVPVVSSWMRIRETMVAGILVWGLSKAAHKFYKEYVSPYFDLKWPQERRLEVIENSVLEMQNNLVETMKKVQDVVGTVQQQQKQMLVLTEQLVKNMPSNTNSISMHHNDQATNELKAELNSIKGILLSRKQFPTAPNTGAGLPTWQLNTSPPVVAAAAAAPSPPPPQSLEPETQASNIPPQNELEMLPAPPPPTSSSPPPSNQTSLDVEETSDNGGTIVSIEDNKEVDNPNYVFANGQSNDTQDSKHASKKSRSKKDDSKKKNNNNVNVNDFAATEQNNKLDKSHVI